MSRDIVELVFGQVYGFRDPLVVDARIQGQVPQRRAIDAEYPHVEPGDEQYDPPAGVRTAHPDVVQLSLVAQLGSIVGRACTIGPPSEALA